jgi:hypothetical protein
LDRERADCAEDKLQGAEDELRALKMDITYQVERVMLCRMRNDGDSEMGWRKNGRRDSWR